MCDHCRRPSGTKIINVVEHCRVVYKILEKGSENDIRLTGEFNIGCRCIQLESLKNRHDGSTYLVLVIEKQCNNNLMMVKITLF